MLEGAVGEDKGVENSGYALFTLPVKIHFLPLWQDTMIDGPMVWSINRRFDALIHPLKINRLKRSPRSERPKTFENLVLCLLPLGSSSMNVLFIYHLLKCTTGFFSSCRTIAYKDTSLKTLTIIKLLSKAARDGNQLWKLIKYSQHWSWL